MSTNIFDDFKLYAHSMRTQADNHERKAQEALAHAGERLDLAHSAAERAGITNMRHMDVEGITKEGLAEAERHTAAAKVKRARAKVADRNLLLVRDHEEMRDPEWAGRHGRLIKAAHRAGLTTTEVD